MCCEKHHYFSLKQWAYTLYKNMRLTLHEAVNEEQKALFCFMKTKTNSTTFSCPLCTENSPHCLSVKKQETGR